MMLYRWNRNVSHMQPFEVLEVILLDLCDLVVLQVQEGGIIWDVGGNLLQTCGQVCIRQIKHCVSSGWPIK